MTTASNNNIKKQTTASKQQTTASNKQQQATTAAAMRQNSSVVSNYIITLFVFLLTNSIILTPHALLFLGMFFPLVSPLSFSMSDVSYAKCAPSTWDPRSLHAPFYIVISGLYLAVRGLWRHPPIHSAHAVKNWYTGYESELERVDWPPESLDFNIIEHLWCILERQVRNR